MTTSTCDGCGASLTPPVETMLWSGTPTIQMELCPACAKLLLGASLPKPSANFQAAVAALSPTETT